MARSARRAMMGTTPTSAEPTGANLLIGKVFSSSVGSHPSETGPVDNITDQDTMTRWISAPSNPAVLTADLQGVYTLDQVRIVWAADTVNNHSIAISVDGSSYTQIATGTTNGSQKQVIDYTSFSASARGRYLRITCTDRHAQATSGSWGNSIWEIEAYGTLDTSVPVGTISNFDASAASTSSVNLSWAYSGAPISGFTLKRGSTVIATPAAGATSYTDSGLTPGSSYTYSITATYQAGGSTNTPTDSVTLAGGSKTVPMIGDSGLPWNHLFFGRERSNFQTWLGRAWDGGMTFATRYTWNDMRVSNVTTSNFTGNGLRVIALPSQPENEGINGNQRAANGEFNSWWRQWGQDLANRGWNNNKTIVRLNWELNGDWYNHSANQPSHPVFIQAWRNVVDNIRVYAPNVLFDYCLNSRSTQAGSWLTSYPGDDYVDIIGLDFYDAWPPFYNESQFQTEANKSPSLNTCAQFARDHGKLMSIDEGGNCHNAEGGGDNPFYWEKMWQWLNANADILAWHVVYNDPGAPSDLHHELVPTTYNPNAAAKFKQLWG